MRPREGRVRLRVGGVQASERQNSARSEKVAWGHFGYEVEERVVLRASLQQYEVYCPFKWVAVFGWTIDTSLSSFAVGASSLPIVAMTKSAISRIATAVGSSALPLRGGSKADCVRCLRRESDFSVTHLGRCPL